MEVYIELDENVERIEVSFRYNQRYVEKIKTINGRRWNPEARMWSVPMELAVARRLRELFGDDMKLGPAVKAWAREQVNLERNLKSMRTASDAELKHTPIVIRDVIAGKAMKNMNLPTGHALSRKRPARPYQRADIAMMSMANCINANDVGTGKTLEAIGAIYEAELQHLPVLVVAPRRALVNVWQAEFGRLTDYQFMTSESPAERKRHIKKFLDMYDDTNDPDFPYALGLLADDLRLDLYKKKGDTKINQEDPLHACRDYRGNWYRYNNEQQRDLFQVEFGGFIIDEFHKTGLNTRTSLFYNSAKQIKAERKWPMSGTPMGGKPRRLWPILNFLNHKEFASEWRWVYDWLEVTEEEIYVRGGAKRMVRTVGGLRQDKEEAFYEYHSQYMTRRTKREALPGLPPMVELLIETPMTDRQAEEYEEFDRNHEIILNGKRLSGSIVLAQYTRLRQMASFRMEHSGERWAATADGGKYMPLIDALDENGIRGKDWEPGARAYIGALDTSFVDRIIDNLRRHGIQCEPLTGRTKESKPIIDRFNGPDEHPFVIVMTVQTGGAALNLEAASSAHLIDEPWDPDETYQFFGRGDRGSRTTPLRCYTYRTPQSVQEYIAKVAGEKKITNRNILDIAKSVEHLRRKV
jgi:SNF2 family DNA or RNA helicase